MWGFVGISVGAMDPQVSTVSWVLGGFFWDVLHWVGGGTLSAVGSPSSFPWVLQSSLWLAVLPKQKQKGQKFRRQLTHGSPVAVAPLNACIAPDPHTSYFLVHFNF